MAGVVLETVSNRKLIAFGITLLLLQVAAYLLGGLIGNLFYLIHGQSSLSACINHRNTFVAT